MARKYSGALSLANAATIDFLGPWDNRLVQGSYDDLKAASTWLSGGNYQVYKGMPVTLIDGTDKGKMYIYTGGTNTTDFTSDDNWILVGGVDADAKIFSYKGDADGLSEGSSCLGAKLQTNGGKVGDVYNITSEFSYGSGSNAKTYPAGTNVVLKQDVAKGTTTISDWSAVIDPLSGDYVLKSTLESDYYTKSSVDILLAAKTSLTTDQTYKLSLIGAEGQSTTVDLLSAYHNSNWGSSTEAVYNALALCYENGLVNFFKAGGYRVKVEVLEYNTTSQLLRFCFNVKGKYYEGSICKTGDALNPRVVQWQYYDSSNKPVGASIADIFNAQAAFALAANQNAQLVSGMNSRITAVENKLKWYTLD